MEIQFQGSEKEKTDRAMASPHWLEALEIARKVVKFNYRYATRSFRASGNSMNDDIEALAFLIARDSVLSYNKKYNTQLSTWIHIQAKNQLGLWLIKKAKSQVDIATLNRKFRCDLEDIIRPIKEGDLTVPSNKLGALRELLQDHAYPRFLLADRKISIHLKDNGDIEIGGRMTTSGMEISLPCTSDYEYIYHKGMSCIYDNDEIHDVYDGIKLAQEDDEFTKRIKTAKKKIVMFFLGQLQPEERFVVSALHGVCGTALEAEEIAISKGWTTARVYQLKKSGMDKLASLARNFQKPEYASHNKAA
jgi:hypothetical protein